MLYCLLGVATGIIMRLHRDTIIENTFIVYISFFFEPRLNIFFE